MYNELVRVIEQYGKEMGIDKKVIIDAIKEAMVTAAKKKFSPHVELDAFFNEETGEVDLFQFKLVVEDDDLADPETEIELSDARKQDPEIELGDSLGIKVDTSEFGRIVARTARDVIAQKLLEAEREIIYSEFLKRRGEIITGIVRRVDRGNVVVDLGKAEAFLPEREQISGESYRMGDRIQAYLLDVLQTPRGPRIILSRASTLYLMKLFELEVPEIADGTIVIKSVAREPGIRAKMAVFSKNPDVDPYGACIGVRGSRIQNIVNELRGEKIDIILYEENLPIYAKNAITPAVVSKVIVYEDDNRLEIIVPDDQLSLAIGRKGVNVRLAAKLIGRRIDILSETELNKRYNRAKATFMQIPNIDETRAIALFHRGYTSINDLKTAVVEDLLKVPGFSDAGEVQQILEASRNLADIENDGIDILSSSVENTGNASADEILKQELKLLIKKEEADLNNISDLLLSIKGIGPSFVSKITDAGFNSVESILSLSEEDFVNKMSDKIKDTAKLTKVYREINIKNKEKEVKEADIQKLKTELDKLEVDYTDKLLVRLLALELDSVDKILSMSKDEFLSTLNTDSDVFAKFYDDLVDKRN